MLPTKEKGLNLEIRTRTIGFNPNRTIKDPIITELGTKIVCYYEGDKPTEREEGYLKIAFGVDLQTRIYIIEARLNFDQKGKIVNELVYFSEQKRNFTPTTEHLITLEELKDMGKNIPLCYGGRCYNKIIETINYISSPKN